MVCASVSSPQVEISEIRREEEKRKKEKKKMCERLSFS